MDQLGLNSLSTDEETTNRIIYILCMVAAYWGELNARGPDRFPSRIEGEAWTQSVLYGHEDRCFEAFRLPLDAFIGLKQWLVSYRELQGSRLISIDQKLAIFLWICAYDMPYRGAAECFKHSLSTISR
jgi:hypothetical protein